MAEKKVSVRLVAEGGRRVRAELEGVGEAGAAALLLKYGTLEAMLKTGRFAREAEQLRLFRRIATMDAKAPLPAVKAITPAWDQAAALAWRWKLGKLAERLDRLAAVNQTSPASHA